MRWTFGGYAAFIVLARKRFQAKWTGSHQENAFNVKKALAHFVRKKNRLKPVLSAGAGTMWRVTNL
jgi:hypothetical protein